MSGTIALAPDVRWSAAGWLFDWTVGFLADRTTDPRAAAILREAVDENLGWFAVDECEPDTRVELRDILHRRLVPVAEEQLPPTVPGRSDAIAMLQQLAELARNSPPS